MTAQNTMTPEAIRAEIAHHQERIAELKAMLPKQPRRLTASFVRDVKHSGGRGPDRHTAGLGSYGLALLVRQGGSKAFIQRLTVRGKRVDLGLGPYPILSLPKARDMAFANAKAAREGGGLEDLERLGAAVPRKASRTPTLEAAAHAAIAVQASGWKAGSRNRQTWERSLREHVFGPLGSRPVDQVEPADLLAVVTPLWGEKRRLANDLLNRLRTIFAWAAAEGCRDGPNPILAVRDALPKNGHAQRKHHASLPPAEVGAAFAAVRAGRGGAESPAANLCLELAILTAVRSGEARGARWREVDLEAKVWTLPASRMKAGKEHAVPLTEAALAVFEAARALGGKDLVFPAPRSGGELADSSLTRRLRAAGVKQGDGKVHGFRASFRTWAGAQAGEHAIPRDLAEECLAHQYGSAVEHAYVRGSRIEARRAIMERWAAFLGA